MTSCAVPSPALSTRRSACLIALTCLIACTTRSVSDDGTSATSTTDASQGTESESTSETTSETGPGPIDLPGAEAPSCDCDEGFICAATCSEEIASPDGTPSAPIDLRCVDEPLCPPDDLDNPACRELVCGSPYVFLRESCSGRDASNIDMLCGAFESPPCDLNHQDCPDGEKCVRRPLDEEGLFPTMCVPLEGRGVPGELCTANGAPEFSDSCGANSMCWSGELSSDVQAGVCSQFCDLADPMCPVGSTCELVYDGLELCVETP
ncbi:hypothetical protein ENSA5_30090 [Enhygromyxa salina]|uniref:Uncharacterized protein n=1 Tax=Enhygromyxa salina TaxID=215803 RepID=A0A2S9XZI3_9BACT|nr:hypothetical protein [Enhygromyxa salina]PRP98277.1 hypothetical protein ENSA5_30090 [Enhygromyxa salina]